MYWRIHGEASMKKNYDKIQMMNYIFKRGIVCLLVGFVAIMLTVEPRIPGYRDYSPETINDGSVKITSELDGNMAKVCVEDNGVGFTLEELEKGESLGIKNMKRRMKLIANGEIKIYSELNKGSKITILVPINENERQNEVEHEDNIRR